MTYNMMTSVRAGRLMGEIAVRARELDRCVAECVAGLPGMYVSDMGGHRHIHIRRAEKADGGTDAIRVWGECMFLNEHTAELIWDLDRRDYVIRPFTDTEFVCGGRDTWEKVAEHIRRSGEWAVCIDPDFKKQLVVSYKANAYPRHKGITRKSFSRRMDGFLKRSAGPVKRK